MATAGGPPNAADLDDAWLNDRSEFQRNWVHGLRSETGLHLQYELERDLGTNTHRVVAQWTPTDDHVSFPGFVHGGLLAAVLDDVMGRSTALLKRWVVTARFEIRYRQPAPAGEPLRVEGWMTNVSRRAVHCEGQLLRSGTPVATATGLYLPLTKELADDMVAAWPGFAEYINMGETL